MYKMVNVNRPNLIHVGFTKEEKEDIIKYSGETNMKITEFIREAIRNKLDDLETKEALLRVKKMYGAGKGKHKITNKMIHEAGEKAVKDIEKELETKEYV